MVAEMTPPPLLPLLWSCDPLVSSSTRGRPARARNNTVTRTESQREVYWDRNTALLVVVEHREAESEDAPRRVEN